MPRPGDDAMDLTVGPNAFFWSAEAVRTFYTGLATAPVARVVIGEWVCSKRLPFWQDEIPGAIEVLRAAGKDVAVTSLALITLKRERKQTADLAGMGQIGRASCRERVENSVVRVACADKSSV